jgi:[ribosomal protein S5]-alanine N-acetyltransferase
MLWYPPANEQELIAPYETNVRAWASDYAYCFTIEEKESNEFIGRISIRPKEGSTWDFGFWTHPEKQNRGYMTEAVSALMRFGFEDLGASRITACHAVWNRASQAVLRKAGMQFIEYIPEGFEKNGNWVPENLLCITRKEWESNQAEHSTTRG